MPTYQEVTRLLVGMRQGDHDAVNKLLPLIYGELHAMAHRQLGRYRPNQTINTTGLVHEAYLKLVDQSAITLQDRQHFFSVSALAMRQIIIDYARQRRAQKRGGGAPHTLLDEFDASALRVDAQAEALLALDQALSKLAAVDERLAQVVQLRFFGGLSVEEAAEVLGVSAPTVKRDTKVARAFLYRAMGGDEQS